jgi:hypothetical protein
LDKLEGKTMSEAVDETETVVETIPEEPLSPCVCGRPRKEKGRKLCYSCTMYKYRYGLTWREVMDHRKTHDKLCKVCDRLCRRNPIVFNGYRVCSKCVRLLSALNQPKLKAMLEMILSQPGPVSGQKSQTQ